MKTLPTWKIAYAIEDGAYEYGDYILREAEEMTAAAAVAEVAAFWCGACDPEEEEAFTRALLEEGYAVLPGDDRAITGLGWGRFSPIIITVRNGFVEAVTGVPDDITVEVQDWNNGELDAQGEPVPTVSEWPGPC